MIVVTLGEITGIGPEIVLKTIGLFSPERVKVIGNQAVLEKTRQLLSLKFNFEPYLLDFLEEVDFEFARPTRKTGKFALAGLKFAVEMLKRGEAKGVVTAPISKENIYQVGFNFPGQTEFFAREFRVKNYCLLAYCRKIKIAFLTLHTPLKKVPSFITTCSFVEKALLLYDFLTRIEGIDSPRIGLFSLNPHGREFSLGEEEKLDEGIRRLKRLGINIFGPLSADAFPFFYQRYDGFISPYHDQGMIIVKSLAFGRGINTTLGLPFVRTSPLHGTAFDIAGKGTADARGMKEAIRLALKWTRG